MSCVCDYDPPEFYQRRNPTARKAHRCDECGSLIQPGESYEYVSGVWERHFDTIKTCQDCVALRDALEDMPCFCWAHHNLLQAAEMQFLEADFSPGLRFNLLRLVVGHRMRRRTSA